MQSSRRRQTGITLVEQLVTASIAGVLAVSSLPGLDEAKTRRRLEGTAAQLESELQFARSSAVARGETVRVAFFDTAAGSCYVIHTGRPRDCRCEVDGSAQCTDGAQVVRSVGFVAADGMRVSSSADQVGFDADHGTATPTTTVQLQNRRGDALRLIVNVMGRIRSCSIGASVPGVPACS
ncbi:MAG: GspH/FimT family pseudopilin [Rubrivivax sp.]